MTSKAVAKRSPEEKVGVFGVQNGELTVLEYSDLDPGVCEATDGDGKLRFRAGNMAVHAFGLDFLDRLTNGTGLPFHRAIKKVPFFDESTGKMQQPASPNAVKYETFIFDALPLASRPLVVESDRAEEFAQLRMPKDRIQKTSQRPNRPSGQMVDPVGCADCSRRFRTIGRPNRSSAHRDLS